MEDVRKNGTPQDIDELRAEIQRTRAELGDTVQALAAKADVKARAKDQVEQTKAAMAARVNDAKDAVTSRAQEAAGLMSVRAHEAKGIVSVRANEAKDAVSVRAHDAGDAVRRNPAPAVAIAVGAISAAAFVLTLWLIRRRR
ncbi:DUF3618 domain-containing protein [Catenuloplanes sp. NPDC051500]|uniref:DUF3618 domain-containing protein n=1 Tax=Catenuloplanes sp. NPDC051500 TaxID=3363959 RepID=UPI0037B6BA35